MKHETETRSQPATGSKADREAVSQGVSGRFTRSDDETQTRAKNGREERKTARDGTPGPMKERAAPTAGKVVIKCLEQ